MQNAARPRQEHALLWSGKKRLWFGAPWTFTTYYIYDNELVVKSGILNQRFDSTKMFRILDITITRSLLQRIFGLSTLLIDSMSYQYLVGAKIDFKEDLTGEQFVIDNPNAVTTCGCGSSFSV